MRLIISRSIWRKLVVLVVAIGLGWWVSDQAWWTRYRALDAKKFAAWEQTVRHRAALKKAKGYVEFLTGMPPENVIGSRITTVTILNLVPEWSVLDEPLVEP